MSATPRAKTEYSRGSGVSKGGFGGDRQWSGRRSGGGGDGVFRRRTGVEDGGALGLILAGALLAALLQLVAEFTTLYQVHVATSSTPVASVSGGDNHTYAMIPLALLAAGLGLAVSRSGSRPALLAIGVVGLTALLIALLGDLPDSQATGLAGSAIRGFVNATSTPSAGLYMETLGSIVLLATWGLGFLMLGPPARAPRGGPDSLT